MDRLYQLQYDLETAKQHVALLKQRVTYPTSSKSLNAIDRSLALSFRTIEDRTLRQRLSDRHEKIVHQTRTDLLGIWIARTEATWRQCQKDFDTGMAQLWQDYRQLSSDQRITQIMIHLIDQRLAGVIERFQAIYDFKMKYFFSQAPTVAIRGSTQI